MMERFILLGALLTAIVAANVQVHVAVASETSFRLSVRTEGMSTDEIPNPSLDTTRAIPQGQAFTYNGMQGLKTAAGALVAGSDGSWALLDSSETVILSSSSPPVYVDDDVAGVVQLSVKAKAPDGPPQSCLANGDFGPVFYYNDVDQFFAFASSPLLTDLPVATHHCYPAAFDSNSSGGARSGWWIAGHEADWYLAPAADGYAFSKAFFDLTGAARVPPRHAMGFMATYWGYDNMQEVQGNMSKFRDEKYPIDSFIMDYDWFGPKPCGPNGTQGGLNCGDFGYEPTYFGNNTFVLSNGTTITTHDPADFFNMIHTDLNFRWAGIRKPRSYSNIELSNTSGWLLPDSFQVGAGDNNWNFTVEAFRDWYTKNHLHFLQDGVDYWWNDEGETQWFTYLLWNLAQQEQFAAVRPNQRMFTVNRAFQPGMQRYPAVTWTGDSQICTHAKILHFSMAGQPYGTCDMTSPDASVLVRQYQNAVFDPIMRVHQMHGTPRFPYLWCGPNGAGGGTPAHCTAFRNALNTRYQLMPYMYSLAHDLHRNGRLIVRPSSFEFPSVSSPGFMVGDSIMPADLSFDPDTVNETQAYLPKGDWFVFNSTRTVAGGQLVLRTVDITEFPVYVRPGAIIPTSDKVIQYAEQLGGTLNVQVYAGRDNKFDLVEDDGCSLDYLRQRTKTTTLTWNDATTTLSWNSTIGDGYTGSPQDFTTLKASLFRNGQEVQVSASQAFDKSGQVVFK
eukprot:m.146330 g.146330  ORF g.146330 m.146330 type:complete len:730 (-) comp16236_c1_seq1:702-2891(-)